jgi:hypothetical protein
MSLSARAIAISGLGFGAALTAVAGLRDVVTQAISTGGGLFTARKPKPLIKPRPAWMPPILWALPLDENDNPLIESTTVGDVELFIRHRLMRRRKDEAELLLLRQF